MSAVLSLAEGRFRAHALAFASVLLLVAASGQGLGLMDTVLASYGRCLGAALVLLVLEVLEHASVTPLSLDSGRTRAILTGFFVIFGLAAWLRAVLDPGLAPLGTALAYSAVAVAEIVSAPRRG